ncbi:MAG: SDR family NAD(P)-dependent oxidoreductase [Promethearchaeota archaeon]
MTNKDNFMNWENPGRALITGSSSGIGAEFARQLASQGFDLILVARRIEKLKALSIELKNKYSISAEVLVVDLSNLTDTEKLVSRILELEDIDVLINNAGFGIMDTFLHIDRMRHVDMINVHFTSPVMLCHATLPGMIKRKRGVIINTSSVAALNKRHYSLGLMYTTTKSAITIFSEILKDKIKGTGIYIQALCPGLTSTEFHDSETMHGYQRNSIQNELWMTPEEVVLLSLKNVKTKDVIFIAGETNLNMAKHYRKSSVNKYLNAKILLS